MGKQSFQFQKSFTISINLLLSITGLINGDDGHMSISLLLNASYNQIVQLNSLITTSMNTSRGTRALLCPWYLFEVLESSDQEELLNEQLRVQYRDVCRASYQGVGGGGQRVVDVETNQRHCGRTDDGLQQIGYHLPVRSS